MPGIDREIFDRYLFNPRSVAVIGASNTPGSWGLNAMKGLLAAGDRRIYPVNPNASEILGVKAFRSVTDVPGPVDLAVIVVAERLVPTVLRECVSKAIKGAVIITSGFGETGEPGRKMEAELIRIARRGGLRFIGPNSMGHADTRSQLSSFGQEGKMPRGPVAVLSQSGSICLKIVRNLAASGIACSKCISTGNEADLRMEDYLEYLAGDDDTRVIAAYIEGLRDGRRFMKLAREITVRKPIVVVKVGGTPESARAVTSHTGALAGSDAIYTAAFRQSGVIRADDDDELCDVVYALINCPLPRGNRVGILSLGGGPAALTAESCEKEGLAIGRLAPATVKKLDRFLPARWPRRNPIDMAGPAAAEFSIVAKLLWPVMEDSNIDIVFLLAPIVIDRTMLVGRMGVRAEEVTARQEKDRQNLKLVREKMEQYGKPVVLMWQWRGISDDAEMTSLFRRERMLVSSNARQAARMMSRLAWYRRYLEHMKTGEQQGG
jgi:acyl-CoA synthetase (NDP forming)